MGLDLEGFRGQGGYFVAGRADQVTLGGPWRNFFHIYPGDLNIVRGGREGGRLCITSPSQPGEVLFHGPYWFLPRGSYRLSLEGEL